MQNVTEIEYAEIKIFSFHVFNKCLLKYHIQVNPQEEGIANSGFLRLKRGTKREKRSWFVLKEHVLYLYKAASDPAAHTTIPVLGYKLDITGNVSYCV